MTFLLDRDLYAFMPKQFIDKLYEDGYMLEDAKITAVEYAKDLMRHTYEVDAIFAPVYFLADKEPAQGDRFYIDAPEYEARQYMAGEYALWNGYVYRAETVTMNKPNTPSDWTSLSVQGHAVWQPLGFVAMDTRYKRLVQVCCDIAIYTLLSRLQPHQIPEEKIRRYEDAKNYLANISEGKYELDLPMKASPQTRFVVGSGANKVNHQF